MTTRPEDRDGRDELDLEDLQGALARQMIFHALPIKNILSVIVRITEESHFLYGVVRIKWMEMKRDEDVLWDDEIGWYIP